MSSAESALRMVKADPLNLETELSALASPITPVDTFFVRSRFSAPDSTDIADRIEFVGAGPAREISIAELAARAAHTVTFTMECAGNSRVYTQPLPVGEPWQHGAVGTAVWKGVPLREVIGDWFDAAEYPWLVVEGMDHGAVDETNRRESFVRGLPMAKAMEPDTILAVELNGAPLSVLRGGPVRLIVPGWYGMASVKWVSRIGVARDAFTGYFQRERYVIERPGERTRPVSRALVKSLFHTPTDEQFITLAPLEIGGWAWSGEREITHVEVATDAGGRWTDAELTRPASPHAWTGWRLRWTPPAVGRYVLRCRATDSAGDVQPLSSAWNAHGYENNGVHAVNVTVEAS